MPEMFKAAITPAVRALLLVGAGWLVSHGVWSESLSGKIVEAVAAALVMWLWAMWEKYKDRLLLNTAAATSKPVSVAEVKEMVKQGVSPPASVPEDRVPYLKGQKPAQYSTDEPKDSLPPLDEVTSRDKDK